MIGKELKVYDGLTPRQQLNLFRNLYYNDGNATEHGIIANAINDCFAADVVPKSEVDMIHHLLKDAWKRIEELDNLCGELQKAKDEVAREIFEEIDKIIQYSCEVDELGEYHDETLFLGGIAELKKKYTKQSGE
jgi:hypothetical protein